MKDKIIEKMAAELELIERHVMMLKATKENQPIGIIRLTKILGMPTHKVRYSLRLLEKEGLILPSKEGAMVTDGYDDFMDSVETSLEELGRRIEALRSMFSGT
jgi:predicted transcriptional regulator